MKRGLTRWPKGLDEWLAYQEQLHRKRVDLGLGRIRKVFQKLLPKGPLPLTITVGGTNGKGSVVALLEAILKAAGYRIGAYTSPHLLRYNERIRIDASPIRDEPLCQAFERVERAREGEPLSFFEFGTLAALDLFARHRVEVQILEVGLGGRLDAVNIVDADAAAITTIDLDHKQWLGASREAIALEKAGILRPHRPAVIGDPDPPKTLLDYIAHHQIPATLFRRDFDYQVGDGSWRWWNRKEAIDRLPPLRLKGWHQYQNAAVVLELLSRIRPILPVSQEAIRKGLAETVLPGRYQWIGGTPEILLDVAHNPQSARALAGYLREEVAGRRIVALFSILGDKDIEAVVAPLVPVVDLWVIAPLESERAAPLETIERALKAAGARRVVSRDRVGQAYAEAIAHASPQDLLLVFGSFLIVAEILMVRNCF